MKTLYMLLAVALVSVGLAEVVKRDQKDENHHVAGYPAAEQVLIDGHVYAVEFSKAAEHHTHTNYYAILLDLQVGPASHMLPEDAGIYCKVSTNLLTGRTYRVAKGNNTNAPSVTFVNTRL